MRSCASSLWSRCDVAVSGMAFYTGERFPTWKRNVLVGGLRFGEIPGTGHVERIVFNDKLRIEPAD